VVRHFVVAWTSGFLLGAAYAAGIFAFVTVLGVVGVVLLLTYGVK
jgi:hypothetical protein